MKLGIKVQYWKNGKMIPFSYKEYTYKKSDIDKPIKRWYRHNPYAKRLNKKWICKDYRIDQQRPQRMVYSEAYIKIIEITEMEDKYLTKLINEIESKIDYPTVWDDGEKRHYEDTIHCPNCGKRRKVLTSPTHCEFCGFEFKNALKCPKCKDLTLKGNDNCKHCGYDFINRDKKRTLIWCSECKKMNDFNNDYCMYCGHKLKKIDSKNKSYKQYCEFCGNQLKKEDKYCYRCGKEVFKRVLKVRICPVCGRWCNENEYCWNCGHKHKNISAFRFLSGKKCPNCHAYFDACYNYCYECGTKLKNKSEFTDNIHQKHIP